MQSNTPLFGYALHFIMVILGTTGGSWAKSGGGYHDNSDEDDNAQGGYSPEPAAEFRDNEGIFKT